MSNYFYDLPIELQNYVIQIKSKEVIQSNWYKFICRKSFLMEKLYQMMFQNSYLINFNLVLFYIKKTSNILTGTNDCTIAWSKIINKLEYYMYLENVSQHYLHNELFNELDEHILIIKLKLNI